MKNIENPESKQLTDSNKLLKLSTILTVVQTVTLVFYPYLSHE